MKTTLFILISLFALAACEQGGSSSGGGTTITKQDEDGNIETITIDRDKAQ